ncbi:hypothetical protein [Mesobacillus jeotgali]|uniref:hypothetical protein n=1 Tax=Mesobacillus jeotgali TaxID=129985 RepID=UPI0009A6E096|nr:hypothetical protein [Mesobacillus jeotgali]
MNKSNLLAVIEDVTEGIYKDYPDLLEKYGERGRQKCREDNEHHIKYLQAAAEMDEEKYFVDYAHWLDGILTSRGMKTEHLVDNFARLKTAFQKMNEDEHSVIYVKMLETAINSLKSE